MEGIGIRGTHMDHMDQKYYKAMILVEIFVKIQTIDDGLQMSATPSDRASNRPRVFIHNCLLLRIEGLVDRQETVKLSKMIIENNESQLCMVSVFVT